MKSFHEIQPMEYGESGINRLTADHEPGKTCFQSHWHDRLELLYILSGEIHLHMNEHTYVAQPGDVVIITPLLLHKGIAGEDGVKYEVLSFDIRKFLNSSVASSKYLTPLTEQSVMFAPLTQHAKIIDMITDLLGLLDNQTDNNPLFAVGKIYELLGLFFQYCLTESLPPTKPNADFSEVLEYISDHLTENLMAQDISKYFGYDNTYFCRKFKAITGSTAAKYIRRLKLNMAKDLLTNSDDSIKDIAWKCGFANISHLSNSFKKKFGVSPHEYRNRMKQ